MTHELRLERIAQFPQCLDCLILVDAIAYKSYLDTVTNIKPKNAEDALCVAALTLCAQRNGTRES